MGKLDGQLEPGTPEDVVQSAEAPEKSLGEGDKQNLITLEGSGFESKQDAQDWLVNRMVDYGVMRRDSDALVLLEYNKLQVMDKALAQKVSADRLTKSQMVLVLAGLKIHSLEDDGNVSADERSLFAAPRSLDEAFDIEQLNSGENDALLQPWEFVKRGLLGSSYRLSSGENLSMMELRFFHAVFDEHKAKRDPKSDRLMVFDKAKNDYVPFSLAWCIGSVPGFHGNIGHNSVRVLESFSNLFERELLKTSDLEFQDGAGAEVFRPERGIKGKTSQIMLDNTLYYVGRDHFIFDDMRIPTEHITITDLDNRTGGVLIEENGGQNLVATFEKNMPTAQRQRVTGAEMQERLALWDSVADNPSHNNESPEEYARRILHLQSYNNIHSMSELFSREGIGIHRLLSWREQQWLCGAFYNMPGQEKDIVDFGKKFSRDGLRTFLSLESGGVEMAEKILAIGDGEKYDQEIASQIFAKYGELVDAADSVEEYLKEEFEQEDMQKVRSVAERLLIRGKALLTSFADSEDTDPEVVIEKLEAVRGEVELFKSSFKILKDSGQELPLAELGAVQFQVLTGPELDSKVDVVERMEEIYRQNYAGDQFTDAFRDKIQESLDAKLSNPRSQFYTLYHKGEIVAFNSFTKQEDGTVHFANFNVDPRYNYSKLGEAMMEASLDKEMQDATIVAEGVPDAPITQTYLSKGFKKVGEVDVGGVTLWKLRREKKEV